MIENDKIGKYIKDLRIKNKMTQEELAIKIHVSRQAVSNWETGKDAPSVDSVKNICILFNVSMVDIYAGEKVNDIKTLNDVIHGLITMEMKKSKKIMLVATIIIFFLIVMFLVYYFITYYNNIVEYVITTDNNKYKVYGIINKSVDNIYFNLSSDNNPDKMCLVYNDKELICNSNSNFIIFSETNGYNEVISLDNKEFNNYISNMYVTIEKDGEIEKIKLDIEKDYQNSNLFKEINGEVNKNDYNYNLEYANVPTKVKEKFKYNNKEKYYYLQMDEEKKHIEMYYFVEFDSFDVIEKSKDKITTKWTYDHTNNIIVLYNVIDDINNKLIKESVDIREKDNNQHKRLLFDYFKENYIDKYLE